MSKWRRLRPWLLAALLALTLLPVGALAAQKAKATTLRLERTEGAVTLRDEREKSLSLSEGMKLYSGYGLETGDASYAYVSLDDAKAVKLDAYSEAEVKASGKKLELKLLSGAVYFDVSEKLGGGESFQISTSTMTTGIRGTKGLVAFRDGVTVIELYEGEVTVTLRCEDLSDARNWVWVEGAGWQYQPSPEQAQVTGDAAEHLQWVEGVGWQYTLTAGWRLTITGEPGGGRLAADEPLDPEKIPVFALLALQALPESAWPPLPGLREQLLGDLTERLTAEQKALKAAQDQRDAEREKPENKTVNELFPDQPGGGAVGRISHTETLGFDGPEVTAAAADVPDETAVRSRVTSSQNYTLQYRVATADGDFLLPMAVLEEVQTQGINLQLSTSAYDLLLTAENLAGPLAAMAAGDSLRVTLTETEAEAGVLSAVEVHAQAEPALTDAAFTGTVRLGFRSAADAQYVWHYDDDGYVAEILSASYDSGAELVACYPAGFSAFGLTTLAHPEPPVELSDLSASLTYGQPLSQADLEGLLLGFGTVTWETPESLPSAGNAVHRAVFTPHAQAASIYQMTTQTWEVTVDVAKADPAAPTGLTAVYGDTLAAVALPEGYAFPNTSLSVGNAGERSFTVDYTPTGADAGNYNAKTDIPVTVTVAKADPRYGLPLMDGVYGQTLADVIFTQSSMGSFAIEESLTTPLAVGRQAVHLTYTPPDTTNYNTLTGIPAYVTVAKADPAIPTGLTAVYGDTLAQVQGLPAGYAFPDLSFSVGDAGEQPFSVDYTPTGADAGNYNAMTGIPVTVTVAKADPSYTLPAMTGVYGQTLEDVEISQPNEGAFTIEDALTTPLAVGDQPVLLTYTPADTDNYHVLTGLAATVTVAKAPLTLVLTKDGYVEDESPTGYTLTGNLGEGAETVEYKPATAEDTAYTETVPTAPGSYTLRVTVAATDYFLSDSITVDFDILLASKVSLDGLLLEDDIYIMDGSMEASGWLTWTRGDDGDEPPTALLVTLAVEETGQTTEAVLFEMDETAAPETDEAILYSLHYESLSVAPFLGMTAGSGKHVKVASCHNDADGLPLTLTGELTDSFDAPMMIYNFDNGSFAVYSWDELLESNFVEEEGGLVLSPGELYLLRGPMADSGPANGTLTLPDDLLLEYLGICEHTSLTVPSGRTLRAYDRVDNVGSLVVEKDGAIVVEGLTESDFPELVVGYLGQGDELNQYGTLTVNGSLTLGASCFLRIECGSLVNGPDGELTVGAGGQLMVDQGTDASSQGIITVEAGGAALVDGSLTAQSGAAVDIRGTAWINGSMTAEAGAAVDIDGEGNVIVFGKLEVMSGASVTVGLADPDMPEPSAPPTLIIDAYYPLDQEAAEEEETTTTAELELAGSLTVRNKGVLKVTYGEITNLAGGAVTVEETGSFAVQAEGVMDNYGTLTLKSPVTAISHNTYLSSGGTLNQKAGVLDLSEGSIQIYHTESNTDMLNLYGGRVRVGQGRSFSDVFYKGSSYVPDDLTYGVTVWLDEATKLGCFEFWLSVDDEGYAVFPDSAGIAVLNSDFELVSFLQSFESFPQDYWVDGDADVHYLYVYGGPNGLTLSGDVTLEVTMQVRSGTLTYQGSAEQSLTLTETGLIEVWREAYFQNNGVVNNNGSINVYVRYDEDDNQVDGWLGTAPNGNQITTIYPVV